MKGKELLLQAVPELTFNVNTQIKEQLKWLIGTGHIEPGDMLPSAGQLADELGLNRNTINWVYAQLRDEGLVSMQKGRGTQVLDNAETEQLRRIRMPMQEVLELTIREARARDFDLQQFFVSGLAYALLHHRQSSDRVRLLLVECRGHDHLFYRASIEQATGAEVETLFIEDLDGSEQRIGDLVQRSQLIVTTLNHAEQVTARFARYEKKVSVIGATVDPSLLLEIAKLKENSVVAFVCLGKTGGEWMAGRVREAGIDHIRYETFGWDPDGASADALRRSDKVYASAAVFSELKSAAPDKVSLFPMKLERSSENMLQHIVPQTGAGTVR